MHFLLEQTANFISHYWLNMIIGLFTFIFGVIAIDKYQNHIKWLWKRSFGIGEENDDDEE